MTSNPPPPNDQRHGRGPRRLDRLLVLVEESRSLRANVAMLMVIIAASVTVTALLSLALAGPLGVYLSAPSWTLVLILGAVVPILVGTPAVLFSDALITRIKGMRRDLQQALTQAQLADRAKGEFLATMSHEIRTPLNGVLGMAQVLEATELDATQRGCLRTIRESGDLLMTIIDDVLDLSRIEAGKIDIDPAPAPLGAVLAGTVQLFAPRAAEGNTELSFTMASDTPAQAVFDSARVRQVLGNLVSNAVKFTHDGRVDVNVSALALPDGDWSIRIEVQDTGIGIEPEAQKRLFQPFSQVDGTTRRGFGGTGLGLVISRRLARMMDGDVTVESTPWKGSTFAFRFRAGAMEPVSAAAVPAPRPAEGGAGDAGSLTGLRVLIVDDSAVNRRVAIGLLTPLGAACCEAEDGTGALELLHERPVDLVLLDMHMPGMDGPATLAALRASGQPWADVPVIALTADAMQGDRERLLALGMQGYVAKPIRRETLRAEIASTLAHVRSGA